VDPVTHALTGCCLGLGLGPEVPKWAMLTTAILAANAPDIDFVSRAIGPETYFAQHHGLTHSLPIALALGGMSAVLVGSFAGSGAILKLLPLALLGVLSHLFLDWITPWGAPFLWPFSGKRLDLSVVGFHDVFITATTLALTVIAWRFPKKSTVVLLVLCGMVGIYLLGRAVQMQRARGLVRAHVARTSSTRQGVHVFARPLGTSPFVWGAVYQDVEHFLTFRVDTWHRTVDLRMKSRLACELDWQTAATSRSLQILRRQYDFITVEKTVSDNLETWQWFSAAVLPDANYRLEAITVFDNSGILMEDRLIIDIRGFYRKLIDAVFEPTGPAE